MSAAPASTCPNGTGHTTSTPPVIAKLVGLVVAVVVILLAPREHEDMRCCSAEPGLRAFVLLHRRKLLDRLRIVDHEQPQALAVAGVRTTPPQARAIRSSVSRGTRSPV